MAAWMIYIAVVGLVLGLAAWFAEHAMRQRRRSSRWVWMAALAGSLLLPAVVSSVSVQLPDLFKPVATPRAIVLREVAAVHLPAVGDWADPATFGLPKRSSLLPKLWIASSAGVLLALLVAGWLLHQRRRGWARARILGIDVYVAPNVGPAVAGLLQPRIVVPAWLLEASIAQQSMVLAHEQAHLDARDPQLLAFALALLAAMPWNPAAWWQLHRLRRAIEVDCDARVLRGGRDLAVYGETLLVVGQHRSAYTGAMTGMSESPSFLEQRIKLMVKKPAKWAPAWALALACLSTGAVAVAAQVAPPNAQGQAAAVTANVSLNVLRSYVGAYRFTPYTAMLVSLDGSQLKAKFGMQPAWEIFPMNETEFFYKVVNAQISFERDAKGQVTGMVLHQNGSDLRGQRMSDAAAAQMREALEARVRNQRPFPNSEVILNQLLERPDDTHDMSPQLAQAMQQQLPRIKERLAYLGPVVSHQFLGVSENGADKYLVRYPNGKREVSFVLDDQGTIVSALFQNL